MVSNWDDFLNRVQPERKAGGFCRIDGTVQFYDRINALLRKDMSVLELGAGRGAFLEDPCEFRRLLHLLKGKVREVIGADVDDAVKLNTAIDGSVVLQPGRPYPFNDASFEMIVSDWVLEHIEDPKAFSKEVERVLIPGGWFCARTNHKWGLTALASRMVPNLRHATTLRRVQPDRREKDIFPTFYRMNTEKSLSRLFPSEDWTHCSYFWVSEPAYHARSKFLWHLMRIAFYMLPDFVGGSFLIFLQKKGTRTGNINL